MVEYEDTPFGTIIHGIRDLLIPKTEYGSYGGGVRCKDPVIETVIVNRCCHQECVDEFKRLKSERDELQDELADCKDDLSVYEAQRPDDDTFSLLAASYERKISQLEAERAALKAELSVIRQAQRDAYRQEDDIK